jgi:hypothetical protein
MQASGLRRTWPTPSEQLDAADCPENSFEVPIMPGLLEPKGWRVRALRKAKDSGIAARLREIRCDWDGEHGAHFFADSLGLPVQSWLNYESGVAMSGEVILKLLAATGVNPHWL